MKTVVAIVLGLVVAGFVLGDPLPEPPATVHDVWTFVGSERGSDPWGRDTLVLLCERNGQVERLVVKYGQDDTYADVKEGDPCPGTLDPRGAKP